jgi:hypothetical protein
MRETSESIGSSGFWCFSHFLVYFGKKFFLRPQISNGIILVNAKPMLILITILKKSSVY